MPLRKLGIPGLLAAISIAIAILLHSLLTVPGGKSPQQVEQEKAPIKEIDAPEMVSVAQLQINRLEQNLQTSEENIQKMFKNQQELNNALSQTNAQLANTTKALKDQRAYIAMIYEKMLELELKTESLGGGLSESGR
jgi:NAD-specific glutamate dehydrogenase